MRTEEPAADRDHLFALALVAAFACGSLLALQSRLNGELSRGVGAMPAALWSFGSGLAALTALLVLPRVRRHLREVPAALRQGRLQWWHLLGGVSGGLLVATQTYAVPIVGVALFLIGVVGGQTVSGLLVDRFGLGPAVPAKVSPARLVASVFAVLGVALAASAGSGGGTLTVLPIVLAFLVGMGTAVQQATNGLVNRVSRDGAATAWVNFAVGTVTLVLVAAVQLWRGELLQEPATVPWWAWCGGLLGIFFIGLAAWAVAHSGVLLFGLVNLTSQLIVALLLDLATPATRDRVGAQMVLGLGITIVAAGLAGVAATRQRRLLRRQR